MNLSRRSFLQWGAAGIGSAFATRAYTWAIEPHHVEFVRRRLPIRHLPHELIGRTLVQLSDIHVGTRVADSYVLDTFQRVSALEPDITVITGDFLSYHPRIFEQLPAVYERAPKGRLATLGILGNHDYGPRWSHPEVAQRLVEIVSALGIHVLRNQIRDVGGLQIAGLDDYWANRFDPRTALDRLPAGRASLVLSHNPDTVDLPVWHDYEGWILAGHTHGGQCKPPFLPPPLLPVRNRRYTCGEFDLAGNRKLYISRGVGHLLQVRFNVRPEVTIFELERA